ncbi:Protein esc1 [Psilocybe cubensis]|uniref:BHLH domain-containing protein n=2 Tax=Psilocybe cubensis TaxID=181762 RepID=A0A8H7Y129_PSICU|nr:Protein esc1 [Psilocybe cubensis]KAH9482665.1 Protein esc1 [Psilocybe cubensis]
MLLPIPPIQSQAPSSGRSSIPLLLTILSLAIHAPSQDHSLVQHDSDRLPYARPSIRDNPPAFDFSMRRHSIAVGQNPITLPNLSSTLHGTKRKMSTDRSVFAPVGEDPDTHLVGPGMPSVMDVDVDAPAPKRRGSTIDTQRIAQLSLNDRRNSVDSRGAHWMLNDRRDSAPSLFPSVPGINSFNSSDSHHSRVSSSIASFSWPANEGPNSSSLQNESNYSNRTFDPVHELSVPPPTSYAPDRRMSVPDNLTHPSSRSGHSRSRPPSRQNTDANSHSGLSSGQEEPSGTSSPNTAVKGKDRDTGLTPYSRSPELRVSHKLAERKRRKEMKELFDELRAQLPADRGMKASKWEILSKAIDFVAQLKQSHQEMAAENSMLRQQLHAQRSESFNSGAGPSSHNNAYGQPILPPFPPPLIQPHQTSQNQSGHPDSRPNSSQTPFPPLNSSSQNGRGDSHPT